MGGCQSSTSANTAAFAATVPAKGGSTDQGSLHMTTSTYTSSPETGSSKSGDDRIEGSSGDVSSLCDQSQKSSSSVGTRGTKGTKCSSRHDSVVEWKNKMHEDGDIAQAVVHIETSETKHVEDVYSGVHDGPVLGQGVAGVVRKCTHKETGLEFAVKCLPIGLIECDEVIESLREEIFVMCQSDHPDITRLEEVYESDSQIYLIENLLTGGDMFDRLEDQPDYHYSEIQCAKIVKQMMNAVRYLHSKHVVHRDLKLENFLFDDPGSDNIRLIDFGLSKHFDQDGSKHHDAAGTPYTAAPEMIKGEYDEKVDVWALGVITYLLLCGDPPFGGMDGEAPLEIRNNILKSKLVFEPKEVWDNVSDEAKNFVKRLLTADPAMRPSAEEAQHDEWLIECAKKDSKESVPLDRKLVNNLLQFRDYSNLQKVLLEVVSFTLVPEQIKGLKEAFEEIDRDGRGSITLEDLKDVLMNHADTGALGALTEEEVETIFDSLRLHKSETTIRWHEFIAAGLSKADYDKRNLRLAFNRFDEEGKGYITFDDLKFMLSADGTSEKEIMNMWQDGMKDFKCKDKLSFEDFQTFLEAQSARKPLLPALQAASPSRKGFEKNQSSSVSGKVNDRLKGTKDLEDVPPVTTASGSSEEIQVLSPITSAA